MKKVIHLMLTFMIVFGVTGSVFAQSPNIGQVKKEEIEEKIENDIKNEIEIARKEIYRQLEQQDALILMGVYEDIIYPQIEEQIRTEYEESNTLTVSRASRSSYYAPNGGLVCYLAPVNGYKPTEVVSVCLTRDDSYQFFLNTNSFTLSDVFSTAIGYVPKIPDIISQATSLIFDVKGINDKLAIRAVKNAGGCAEIINTYSREWGTKASILTGWSDRYNITVPSNAMNVTFRSF
ncbi:hypothetical protein [Clostridium cochlearium]|uniref:hypothetical protein n=1 Tax=Clostridium cochlearium TaxID=1494 RepID=UPI00156F1DB1|nr:hypothetical protein [Clostridium cochlearium]MBV1821299.1 hypothetical protein [Bacteroidales bacterium MSK.15.36]MCG4572765.1 hypothetical protein [Clostridium cochlearium]MCG4580694.1 hypothetical protein [Clostridium cochlearium]NSJ92535.1 hypothetical protein [Coprococcus sp. MSK.21.13]